MSDGGSGNTTGKKTHANLWILLITSSCSPVVFYSSSLSLCNTIASRRCLKWLFSESIRHRSRPLNHCDTRAAASKISCNLISYMYCVLFPCLFCQNIPSEAKRRTLLACATHNINFNVNWFVAYKYEYITYVSRGKCFRLWRARRTHTHIQVASACRFLCAQFSFTENATRCTLLGNRFHFHILHAL